MRPIGTLAVVLAFAYGLVDELHQWFTAGRVASIGDLLSDLSGAALAVAVAGALVGGDRCALRRVPWLVLASFASVAAATWWF
jgi:VanZ family protein